MYTTGAPGPCQCPLIAVNCLIEGQGAGELFSICYHYQEILPKDPVIAAAC